MTGTRLMGFRGKLLIRVTGACPEDFLYLLAKSGVAFRDYKKHDPLTAELLIPFSKQDAATVCAKKAMCDLEIIRYYGVVPSIKRMRLRLIYLALLALVVFSVFGIQERILFLEVEGADSIPSTQILRLLEAQGVGFWTSYDSLDMEHIKNSVLSQLPELSYITINKQGGIATVIVRQREIRPDPPFYPSDILAKKRGIITTIHAIAGTPQVKPGDVVIPGQLLISGVSNLDKTLLVTKAEGEVYARTFSRKCAVFPEQVGAKVYTGRQIRQISVSFGKKTIKFYKSSGIPYDNYDKMTVRKTLTLPGDYRLPAAVTVTTLREYHIQEQPVAETDAVALLRSAVVNQMQQEMTAGVILKHTGALTTGEGLYRLVCDMECREEIGSVVEIMD